MFIDRKEILALNECLSKLLRTGEGSSLIVSAEAGIGKTTLIKKFISDNYVNSERKIISGYGYCINMNSSTRSYFPWKEAIIELDTNLLTLNYLHGSEEKGIDYKKIIKTAFDGTGTDWIKSIPQIGNISALIYKTIKDLKKGFDIQEASNEIKKISEGISFNNTDDLFAAITVRLRSLSEKYPIIIFIDDIQWMDISSRDLFFYLSKSIKDNPFSLLLIGAYNTDELFENDKEEKENRVNGHLKDLISNLKKFETAEFITVKPFDSGQFNEYIDKTYSDNKFSDKFLKRIDDITDGNVFFLKQTLDNLEEEKIIYKESGIFLNKDVEEYYSLPATINDAILEKWEKLPDDYQEILQIASVMGEDFSVEIICLILKENQIKIFRKIEKLKSENKIITDSEKEYGSLTKIFQFVNTLFQRFVYATIENDFKTEYHKLIAEEIRAKFKGSNITKVLPQYIFHLGIGHKITDVNNKVILTKENFKDEDIAEYFDEYFNHLKTIAENNIQSYSNEEAINKIDTLVTLSLISENIKEEINFKIKKGNILILTGNLVEAENLFNEILLLAEKENGKDMLAESNLCLGNLKMRKGNLNEALNYLDKSMKFFEETGNKDGISRTMSNIGIVNRKKGVLDSAIKFFRSSLEIRKEVGDKKGQAKNYSQIGNILNRQGKWEEAKNYYEDAIKIAEELNEQKLLADFLSNSATIHFRYGDYQNAIEILNRSLSLHEKVYDVKGIAETKHNLAANYFSLGEVEKAQGLYSESVSIFKKIDDNKNLIETYYDLASTYFETNNFAKANEFADIAISIGREKLLYIELCNILSIKANILFVMKDYENCSKVNDEVIKLYAEKSMTGNPLPFNLNKAKLLLLKSEEDCKKAFNELIEKNKDENNLADIYFEMSQLFHDDDFRKKSLELYEKIYLKSKSYSDKLKIEKLKHSLI